MKIVVIGAGSSYTPELIDGLLQRAKRLNIKEIALVDIPMGEKKLEIITELTKRMIKHSGFDILVYSTMDRISALKGANFVVTQLRVGQIAARILDERIPLQYGVIGQETNGPGGLMKGLRTIPVILSIIEDMKVYCPDAWLINFTNPTGMISEAVLRYGNFDKYIGLCNVPITMKMEFAKLLNVPESRISVDFAGLNHMVYALKVYLDQEDVTTKLMNLLREITMKNIKGEEWDIEFIQALGVIPCPYHRYYYKETEMLIEEMNQFALGKTRGQVVRELEEEIFHLYQDETLVTKPKLLEERGGAYYSEAACRVIEAIHLDLGTEQYVNIRNNGMIQNLDPNVCVEVTAIIDSKGAHPTNRITELPNSVLGLVQSIKSFEIQAAKAAISGNYLDALLAMNINPLIHSDVIARKILDELLGAHREYLPQFYKREVNHVKYI